MARDIRNLVARMAFVVVLRILETVCLLTKLNVDEHIPKKVVQYQVSPQIANDKANVKKYVCLIVRFVVLKTLTFKKASAVTADALIFIFRF